MKELTSLRIRINSLLMALFFMEKELILALQTRIEVPNISFIFMCFFSFAIILNNRIYNIKFLKTLCTYLMVIFSFFIISGVNNGFTYVEQYLKQFVTFGVMAAFFILIKVNYNYVIAYILRASLVFCLFYLFFMQDFYQTLGNITYGSVQMAIAYNFLPLCIVAICYSFDKENGKKHFFDMDYIISVIVFTISSYVILFDCFTRGAIFAILLSLFIVIFSNIKSFRFCLIAALLFCVSTVFLFDLESLLNYTSTFFETFNLSVPAIERAKALLLQDNLHSGRKLLYEAGLNIIFSYPFFGTGIGYFESLYGVYVHNFMLELLMEVGVILGFVAFYSLIKVFYSDFFQQKVDSNGILRFRKILFLATFTPIIFSSTLWLSTLIWLYIFSTLVKADYAS